MRVAQGSEHRRARPARGDDLDPVLGDALEVADRADGRVRAVDRAELAGARGRPAAFAVVAEGTRARREQSRAHRVGGVGRHHDDPLVGRGFGLGLERSQAGQAQRSGEGVRDSGVRAVGVGVRGEQGATAADEAVDQRTLGRVRAHRVHSAQQQWVVHEQQLRAPLERFVDDGRGRVDGEQHLVHRLVGSPTTSPTESQLSASDGG